MPFFGLIVFSLFFSMSTAQTTSSHSTSEKESKDSWRELAESGNYQEAIHVLFKALGTSKRKEKHEIYWHIGQLYAFNNEYDSAIKYT